MIPENTGTGVKKFQSRGASLIGTRRRQGFRFPMILLSMMFAFLCLPAQRSVGFRFGTDANHFYRGDENEAREGWWSNAVLGIFYQAYFPNGGFRLGGNLLHKSNTNRGFPNLPVIMNDFSNNTNIGFTALEMDLKVGPRFSFFNPQTGYLIGFQMKHEGYVDSTSAAKSNSFYISVPFGCSFDFPTGYGAVGFGIFYEIGLSSVLNEKTIAPSSDAANGSRWRTLNIEIIVSFMTGKQERRTRPLPPVPIQ